MPILNIQFEAGEAPQPDGSTVMIEPKIALAMRGPLVQVIFGLGAAMATQLVQQGQPVPAPVSGLGMIDTGASTTCIDEAAAQAMGLPVIDVVQMTSASHASTPANVYPIQLQLIGTPIRVEIQRAVGAELKTQGLLVLIGRDFLANCTLFYNGFTGSITLAV